MKSIQMTALKAGLEQYLRDVEGGESVLVLRGDKPIASIVPTATKSRVLTGRPPIGSVSFWDVPLPDPYRGRVDIVDLLLEERSVER